MAKVCDKNQSGCMRGLVNIFDFRHVRPSQKLLADKKRGSRRIAGAANPGDEINRRQDSCEISGKVKAEEQHETASVDKKEQIQEGVLDQQISSVLNSTQTRRGSRKSTMSFDLNDVCAIPEKPTHRKHKSLSSLDVSGMMAELRSLDCSSHDQTSEDIPGPPREDLSVTEERLEEATRAFVRHFVEGKNARIQPSEELMEAIQILNSNKDMFLKLLRDPGSRLVKDIQKLDDHQAYEDENSIDLNTERKTKHRSFFWRRFKKGVDRNERPPSHFFFTGFTRRLALAMRKERRHLGSINNTIAGEGLGMASPTRDHFYIEKVPESSLVSKAAKKAEKSFTPEQQIFDIYSEAKKHIAETLGDTQLDVAFFGQQESKPLGRILSFSENASSPICSPRKDGEIEGNDSNEGSIMDGYEEIEELRAEDAVEIASSSEIEVEMPISSDALSEPCSPSIGRNELAIDTYEDSKEGNASCSDSDVLEGKQPSLPLESSPVSSKAEDFEDSDAITDVSERRSPISVLEPIFTDDDVSPTSTKSLPAVGSIVPRQIVFEYHISLEPSWRTWEEERCSVFDFVKAVVEASGLTHDQLLEKFLFSDHLLDPSLLGQMDFRPGQLCYDPQLLFDLVNEVILEVCGRDFDAVPSLYKPYTRMKLKRRSIIHEIWEGVDWHLQSEHTKQHTLDQTVGKDFSKSWTWMDLRLDSEGIGIDIEDDILDELVEETIFSLISQTLH